MKTQAVFVFYTRLIELNVYFARLLWAGMGKTSPNGISFYPYNPRSYTLLVWFGWLVS